MHAKLTLSIGGKVVTRVYDFTKTPALLHIIVEPAGNGSTHKDPKMPPPSRQDRPPPWWRRNS